MSTLINLFTVVHILAVVGLIILVLVQDTKSGGALGIGGASNANSILGATGAQSIAAKLTVGVAVIFACTSIGLAYFASRQNVSAVDRLGTTTAPITTSAPETAAPQTATPEAQPAQETAPTGK